MGQFAGFSKVQMKKPERSKFDLSHEKKLSCRMGQLIPIFISETLPNDTFRVNSEVMIRFAPLLAPIYHRVNVFVHFFFVPTRLLYADWEDFITNGRLGTETPPELPWYGLNNLMSSDVNAIDVGSLWDYLGGRTLPDTDAGLYTDATHVSCLPFAAYNKIYQDYYRDRNYVPDSDELPLGSGEQATSGISRLKTRAWQHDYFTSALPWTQRGDEVLLPVELTGYAPIVGRKADGSISRWNVASTLTPGGGSVTLELDSDPNAPVGTAGVNDFGYANLGATSTGTGFNTTINDLRQAVRLQEWLEKSAVAGSRYNENIMAHFARRTSDGRLQRAEYLGGGRVPVQISEVMTTAFSADADSNVVPPATMTGRGASYMNKAGFKYNCEEHGFVLGIMSVMPTSAYMQGTPRMFFGRETFLDYPWPSFAHLGEQEVYNYEIYTDPTSVPKTSVEQTPIFGYQSRYADWKWMPSTAHGDFRTTLDYWHLDRKFAAQPTLDNTFVEFEDTLQDRIFAVSDVDTLWCYIHNAASVVRSLPYFGTPRL